jgi:hypothetical protein
MSLSFQPIEPVLVRDPRTILENARQFAVLKCGSTTTWKQWTSSSISTSSIQFTVTPPSGGIIIDRKIYFYLPVRLSFTGTPSNGVTLLNVRRDAPRYMPIASCLDTIQMSINNQSVSFNCADVIHALLRYNTDAKLKTYDYSLTPSCPDNCQNYADVYNSISSPMSQYTDYNNESVMGRGGFPFTIVANPVSNGDSPVTAIIDVAFCEPLFISPLYFGMKNGSGFYNVNSMDFTMNFISQIANRMWSHDPTLATIVSSSATFGGQVGGPTTLFTGGQVPLLLIQYITPQETQLLSPAMPITYPYFDVQRFITTFGPVAPQAIGTFQNYTSNNIQLSSIPRRIYAYVRMQNNDLYANASNTDSYFQINAVQLQLLNQSGLMSSATAMDLYKMSRKNHLNMSWTEWSGQPVMAGNWSAPISPVCGPICIELASDVGLDSLSAPGKLQQTTLQVILSARNCSGRTITPSLYIVVINEGTFTIQGLGSASTNIGVITSKDILDCQSRPWVDYNDIQKVNGGDFFSGLRDFGAKINDFLKGNKIISRALLSPLGTLADAGLSAFTGVPIPASRVLGHAADYFGYGHEGGELVGGRRLARGQLRKRLH